MKATEWKKLIKLRSYNTVKTQKILAEQKNKKKMKKI